MKKVIICLSVFFWYSSSYGQTVYNIEADSVRMFGMCDTTELIIENSTRHINGYLFNKGGGLTEFRKIGLIKVGTDMLAISGQDTISIAGLGGGSGSGGVDTMYSESDYLYWWKGEESYSQAINPDWNFIPRKGYPYFIQNASMADPGTMPQTAGIWVGKSISAGSNTDSGGYYISDGPWGAENVWVLEQGSSVKGAFKDLNGKPHFEGKFCVAGKFGVGTHNPQYYLDVQGTEPVVGRFSGRVRAAAAKTNDEYVTKAQLVNSFPVQAIDSTGNVNFTVQPAHYTVILSNTTVQRTMQLPDPALVAGRMLVLKTRDDGASGSAGWLLDRNLVKTDGSTVTSLSTEDCIIQSDGTDWLIIHSR